MDANLNIIILLKRLFTLNSTIKTHSLLTLRNICVVFFLFFHSFSFAQTTLENKNKNIILQLYKVSLIEVIKAIETQSSVSFVYNTSIMKSAQKVCIDVEDADINILLQKICKESGNNYKVINNQIVFFKAIPLIAKPIKDLIDISQESLSQHILNSENFTQSGNNTCNPSSLLDTADISIPDINENGIPDSLKTSKHKTDSIINKANISPISQKISNQDCSNSLARSFLRTPKRNSSTKKHSSNKFFYSIQINKELGISSGFNKGDTLSSEEAEILNNSVMSYGLGGGIKLGYTSKRFSFKTGLRFTQFIEKYSIRKTYKIFSKQTYWERITWKEQSSEGIVIHTDTIPITQTIVNDSVATQKQTYKSLYLEIPFDIDYTIPFNAKWSVFGSLGISYAITLKNSFTTPFSVYNSKTVNKLDISVGANAGLKFNSSRLQYYFITGGQVRTTLTPRDKLISRNPIYLNMEVGIINYF